MDEYDFLAEITSNIGQTVTVFTTSGGESGRGFTGVLTIVNPSFIRLVTNEGIAPGCALGNCCDKKSYTLSQDGGHSTVRDGIDCCDSDLGALVDIPVDKIAAFVHNSVGSH